MGYANRVITIQFPELTDDPDDRVWVTIKNPKLLPPGELMPDREPPGGTDGDGNEVKMTIALAKERQQFGREMLAKLIIGWRVYDASAPVELDPATGEVIGEQQLLPSTGVTADMLAKAPAEIVQKLDEVFAEAVNPKPASEPSTPKTSSS